MKGRAWVNSQFGALKHKKKASIEKDIPYLFNKSAGSNILIYKVEDLDMRIKKILRELVRTC